MLRDKVKKIEGYADDSYGFLSEVSMVILAGPSVPFNNHDENCNALVQIIVSNEQKYNISLSYIATPFTSYI